jgi:predicted dehydrogenase
MHKDNTIMCLEAGKATLCEKPFTVNADEADQVVRAARDRSVFCMEAMWSRFVPSMVRLRELLAEGAVGEVRMVMADFGFRTGWSPAGRALNPRLAGGGLLDVGIYPLSLASMILGRPESVCGLAHIGETGVDEQAAVVLKYPGGCLAVTACGVRTATPQEAWVIGTEGRIHLGPRWWAGGKLTLHAGGRRTCFDVPIKGNGYNYEAEEVMHCLAAGKTESDVMPLDESVELMETMDEIRRQWGLRYPME